MPLTEKEFEKILADPSKQIVGDIEWQRDEDHSPCWEFRVEVQSESRWPLFVRGSFNPEIPALTFALILKSEGRIYALDLGKDHHNPTCENVGEKHKHSWTEAYRDKIAYVPEDITAPAANPGGVWRQFCAEAKINHVGKFRPVPPTPRERFP